MLMFLVIEATSIFETDNDIRAASREKDRSPSPTSQNTVKERLRCLPEHEAAVQWLEQVSS